MYITPRDNVESSDILPWGYAIYRKDRKSRAGRVLLAITSSSFTTSYEVNFGTDLELVTVKLTSKSNLKYLVCYQVVCVLGSQSTVCEAFSKWRHRGRKKESFQVYLTHRIKCFLCVL